MSTAEDLLRRVEQEQADAEGAAAPGDDDVDPELLIEVDYRLGNGERRKGAFLYRVPTPNELAKIAVISAGMRGGQPRHAFNGFELDLFDALAYAAVTLKRRPSWAEKSLGDVPETRLLFSLVEEGRKHAARFQESARDLRPRPAADGRGGVGDPTGVGGSASPAEPG